MGLIFIHTLGDLGAGDRPLLGSLN